MTAETFCLRLTKDCAVQPGAHVLVAVSGGADSTALLCFFDEVRRRLGLTLSCAHVEHGIRGEASQADMEFVRALCEQKNIPFYGTHVDVPGYARAHGDGLENAARTLRYAFLEETADAAGADCIALAHHALDQAETVLLHAARGSDLRGLGAMRARRGRYVRPLLKCMPEELREYLVSIGQTWREDETNASLASARNRIRHEAMPALEAACPGAAAALCRLALAAQRDEDYFAEALAAHPLGMQLLTDGLALPRAALEALPDALRGRALVRACEQARISTPDARQVAAISGALGRGERVVVNLPGGAHAELGARWLCLTRTSQPLVETPLLPLGETVTPFGSFLVRDACPGETGDGRRAQVVPEKKLLGAVIAARREGDVLTPFGRHTPVKIKRLMIDAGIERPLRASIPLLRREREVLWAVGLRSAEGCRVRPGEPAKWVEYRGFLPEGD